jgi:hypothetical protein
MQITNNGYNADTRTVSATFVHEGVTHTRDVNACFNGAGEYDENATATRLEEVSSGVAAKIAVGAITNPPPVEEAPAPEEVPAPAAKKAGKAK